MNTENDQMILDIMRNIFNNGDFVVETFNEAVLVKLMELRGSPIFYIKSHRDINRDYAQWQEENKQIAEDVLEDLGN